MRWSNHIEVTDRATDGLIPFEDRVRLCQYNVKTDDIVKDMPHHEIYPYRIEELIYAARWSLLKGDWDEALEILGRALHFIQDRCVEHGWEDELEGKGIDMDRVGEYIERIEGDIGGDPPPRFMMKAVYRAMPVEDESPGDCLARATALSRLVAERVFDRSPPPEGLEDRYRELNRIRNIKIVIRSLIPVAYLTILSILYNGFLEHIISGFNWFVGGLSIIFKFFMDYYSAAFNGFPKIIMQLFSGEYGAILGLIGAIIFTAMVTGGLLIFISILASPIIFREIYWLKSPYILSIIATIFIYQAAQKIIPWEAVYPLIPIWLSIIIFSPYREGDELLEMKYELRWYGIRWDIIPI